MKIFWFSFALLLVFRLGFSQTSILEKEIEIKYSDNLEENYEIIPLHVDGLLLLNTQSDHYGRDFTLNFTKLDTAFNQIWSNVFKPEKGFYIENQFYNNDFFYMLFRPEKKDDIIVIKIDLKTGEILYLESKLLTGLRIHSFMAIKNKVLFAGELDDKPVVEMLNFFDNSSKVLPDLYDKNYEIRELNINEENNTIYVMLKQLKNCNYFIKEYDYDGKLVNTFSLGEKDKVPLNAQILNLPNQLYVMAGNYSNNCSSLSSGIYIHPLNFDRETQYYDYSNFKNFYRYLPPKKKEKINKRINNKKSKGKDNIIRNRVLLHNIEPYENGFFLVGEVYYPEYKNTIPIVSTFPNSNEYVQRRLYENYNNFKFTNALIVIFDENGNLKWENSFNLNNLESQELFPKVQATYIGEDNFLLAYPDNNLIKTEKINKSSSKESIQISNLDQMKNSPFQVNNMDTELLAWYEDNFLAYGTKSFINPADNTNVFFFSLKKIKPIQQNPPN